MHCERMKLGLGPADTTTCKDCVHPLSCRMAVALLIAEDEESLGDTMAKALADAGFEVRLARDGVDVLSILLGGYRPRVVLTDIAMPCMDALALLSHLAVLLPGTSSLVLTARPPEDVLIALRRTQCAGEMLLLLNPIQMKEIIEAIHAVRPAQSAQPSSLAREGCSS